MKRPRSDIKPDPLKHCEACGEILHRRRFNGVLESMNCFLRRHFCNRQCMAAAMTKEVCGSLSHSRIKAHRSAAGPCARCGAEYRIHVHHLDGNPRNNDPANLTPLCPSCHSTVHSPYFDTETGKRVPCLHCDKPSVKIGLCNTHLTRRAKYGDPLLTKKQIGRGNWVLVRE